jgi:hypothetical protein
MSAAAAAAAARTASHQLLDEHPAQNASDFTTFPYLCPEPVLVK